MKLCLQIQPLDNVATLLEDASAEAVKVLGGADRTVDVREPIELGHKVALETIAAGAPVVKYGIPIGVATREIGAGEWVHLHNCRSRLDERSSGFDVHSGAAGDTRYE